MEAFSLLKYWRGGAATSSSAVHGGATSEKDSENEDEGPFFDLKLSVPVETGSTGSTCSPGSDEDEPSPEPVHPPNGFSRLKSATNFRVLLLKLKKNGDKSAKPETGKNSSSSSSSSSKFFTIKFKVEEVPMRSVFKRENSSNAKPRTGTKNERRFSKDVTIMQRYLKMVSKRYGGGERERFPSEAEMEEGGRKRRDDSLVQQQDGIQSAILHCKRSFNSSRDAEMSMLSRSVSDPSQKCSEEFKENGF